ncbi:MAG: type VII secretion protein EccB [Actinoallomurus sp.]
MQTRKDLLQAHRLMTQRAAQALMLGEPDTPEFPLRRLNVASFIGLMAAVLVTAGFGIVGLLKPSSANGITDPGTIIIEKETGARYIWCLDDVKKLCPVANYTSAKLLTGTGQAKQALVSRDALANYDRGPTVGIPGAPDTLPAANKLVKMPWSVCVRSADLTLAGHASLVTLVAGKQIGGQPLPGDKAILVQAGNQPWVIWRNKRMQASTDEVAALTSSTTVPRVAPKWLNALPAGADFKAPTIPGLGQKVAGPQGQAKVGQIFTVANVTGSTSASYVLLSDGLAQLTEIQARLLQADTTVKSALGGSVTSTRLDPGVFAQAPRHSGSLTSPDLEGAMPSFLQYTDSSPLCATYSDQTGNSGAQVSVGADLPPPPDNVYGGANNVDQLVFPPGGAALVGVLPSQGKAGSISTVYLVTEGRRFGLQSKDLAQKLGYTLSTDAVPVPAGVVELIPAGPVLDPTAARHPVSQQSAQPQSTAQPPG